MTSSKPAVVTRATRAPLRCKQRVGADRGAVKQNQRFPSADLFQRFGNGSRGIVRSRKHLEHPDAAAIQPHTVGKRSASVDGNAERL